jgi:hypothetical protein
MAGTGVRHKEEDSASRLQGGIDGKLNRKELDVKWRAGHSRRTMKRFCYVLLVFCFVYLVRAEWLVYQHYLVINRDYYPIMSEFYRMYAERVAGFAGQAAAIVMGLRGYRFRHLL